MSMKAHHASSATCHVRHCGLWSVMGGGQLTSILRVYLGDGFSSSVAFGVGYLVALET
ncbi:hypothetical protein BDN67DRAFT_967295 [Paxillus ammoniavirescens]|nr:hypothetical protein BDN67DRAFT_967295 [Paxillus ammoniavirescens]